MKNNTKSFLIKHQLYLLAFFLPVSIMLGLFMIKQIYPFGESSFLNIDMYHQYFPFLSEFYHKLKEGESLLYSFNIGIGSNFIDLYGYYLASPTNWLVFLCPEAYIIEFMSYMTIIKIGLCSLSFVFYAKHHFQSNKLVIVLFGFAYSFSGYLAAYNWNVMWLDCVILAPLILLGLELLVKEGKCKLYCITLAFCILTNYYLSIMICFFLVFYFFILFISATEKRKALIRFTGYSLLAGGIASALLFPALEMLTQSEYASSTFPTKITTYFPIFDVLSRHLANVSIETGLDKWPNIYCSVAVMYLLPFYIICKKIPFKEKVGKLSLIFFMLLSFSTNFLTFIWHGFNYPNSLPSRQSFLYILLLLMMCLEAVLHLNEVTKKKLCRVGIGIFTFTLLCQKLVTDDGLSFFTYILSWLVLMSFGLVLYFYVTKKYSHKKLLFATFLVLIVELTLNMGVTSLSTVSRTHYLKHNEGIELLTTNLKEADSDFYRINKEYEITKNDGSIIGYPSITLFSSTTNSNINQFYEKYGLQQSKVYYGNEGLTPFTSSLLTNKYILSTKEKEYSPLYTEIQKEADVFLYENKYSLPLGFMIPAEIPVQLDSSNPIEQQNKLSKELGLSSDLFIPISVNSSNDTVHFTTNESAHFYAYSKNKVPEINATINNSTKEFKKLKNNYILDLGYLEANTNVSLTTSDSSDLNLTAYVLQEDRLAQLINQLQTQSLVVTKHQEAYISGEITVLEKGDLFLSIPYEPNWVILVDGIEADYDTFEDTFITVPLDEGTHSISLSYTNPSLTYGFILSGICIIIFIVICLYPIFQHRKKAITVTSDAA